MSSVRRGVVEGQAKTDGRSRRWRRVSALLVLVALFAAGGPTTGAFAAQRDAEAPLVEMLSPVAGEWAASRTVTVSFRVEDASEIERATVELRNRLGSAYDGTTWVSVGREPAPRLVVGSDGAGTFSLTLPDALFDDEYASYRARVVVRNEAGNQTVVVTDFLGVRDPAAPPAMLVDSPLPRWSNPETTPLRVEVAADSGIERVTYRIAGEWPPLDVPNLDATTFGLDLNLATDTSYRINVTGYAADDTRLAFVSYRFRGPDSPPPTQTDFDAPDVSIVNPLDGTVFESIDVPIEFEVVDESDVAAVRYLLRRDSDGHFLQAGAVGFAPEFALVEAEHLGGDLYGLPSTLRLEYGEQYRVRVIATDEWGNRSIGDDRVEVTFFAPSDLDAPIPRIVVAKLRNDRLRLETYSQDSDKVGSYPIRVLFWIRDPETGHYLVDKTSGVFEEGFRTIASGASAEFELPPGNYRARMIAIDPAGNRGVSESFDITFDPGAEDPPPVIEIAGRQDRPDRSPQIRIWFPSPFVDSAFTEPTEVRYSIQDVATGQYLKGRKTWLDEPYINSTRTHFRDAYRYRGIEVGPGVYRVNVNWTDSAGANRDAEYEVTYSDGQVLGPVPAASR